MNNKEKHFHGIPTNALILPIEIIQTILLILVVILVYEVNRSSSNLSDLMEKSSVYLQETMDLQAGVSTLSETAVSYVQIPVIGNGEPNVGPLQAYVEELGKDRRGPRIAERFNGYDVSDEVREHIKRAADTSLIMENMQLHAIALVKSVYPLPPLPELAAIQDVQLTEEEQALPEEARIGKARQILGSEYAQLKHVIAEDVSSSTRLLQQEFSIFSTQTKRHVMLLRTALWIVIAFIVAITLLIFAVLRIWVVRPLRQHTREISADEDMKHTHSFREMQVMVDAYNALLNRRNRLENILRSAAETDTLTGLSNRYSMERYALEASGENSSMAVLMFDVNFLKQTNDAEGHKAGDELIRNAARCIQECFAVENNDNCYRIGGDEFAAVLRGCSEEEVKTRLDLFSLAQERDRLSVSVGYAFTQEADEDSLGKLLDLADRQMYKEKKQVHKLAAGEHQSEHSGSGIRE